MDHKARERQVRQLSSTLVDGRQLESLEDPGAEMYGWIDRSNAREELKSDARRAVGKLPTNAELTPRELEAFEAIILPEGRPALDIVGDSYLRPESPWTHLDKPEFRQRIQHAIPSIGRLEIPSHPRIPYAGTAFVVGEGLLMTNRHVAEIFVLGLGLRDLTLRSELTPVQIDFKRERIPSTPLPFRVTDVLMVHPYWDMALLRVAGLESVPVLELQAIDPAEMEEREVAVIGYPAMDPRNDMDLQQKIFNGVYEIKRLQPGKLTGRRTTTSFGKGVPAFTHEASTLGGNSGSAVLDVTTGKVVGLHFGGVYRVANFGVPAFELKRDPRVLRAGVRFTNDAVPAEPDWLQTWSSLERSSVSVPSDITTSMPANVVTHSVSQAVTAQVTFPLTISVTIGEPLTLPIARPAVKAIAGVSTKSSNGHASHSVKASAVDVDEARRRAQSFSARDYFDAAANKRNIAAYYADIDPDSNGLFGDLSQVVSSTHHTRPRYAPSRELYPAVDRQPDGKLRSLYSAAGHTFTFEELLQADLEVEEARLEALRELVSESAFDAGQLEALEAANPFNCEHVVPQSWFAKKEPMRGDLHHLFTCESGCNSFRGNRAFFDFGADEAVRQDCGESGENRFEPGAGKGAAARAVLYFLVRYPKLVGTAELPADRIETLLRWHEEESVSRWEQHRNETIFAAQGNRNPFIDHPEWATLVDFSEGLGRGKGRATPTEEVAHAILS